MQIAVKQIVPGLCPAHTTRAIPAVRGLLSGVCWIPPVARPVCSGSGLLPVRMASSPGSFSV